MCCSTGVCGPSIDKELLRVATIIENLTQKGADISRFNLSSNPKAFVENQIINDHLKQHGPDILPIILVDGQVAKTKGYPTNPNIFFSQSQASSAKHRPPVQRLLAWLTPVKPLC